MNNIAAAVSAYAGLVVGVFASLRDIVGGGDPYLMVSCFISAALVAHLFGEAVTSTYVGIPAEDVVSVLPAHRLAKAGLGLRAVQSSATGTFAGVLIGIASVLPICAIMGGTVGLYSYLKMVMFPLILVFSALLLVSEGFPSLRLRHGVPHPFVSVAKAAAAFTAAGALGLLVFDTDYYACDVPDLPWTGTFVPRSSLLLPLFAGLFGVPGLLLSLASRSVSDVVRLPSPRHGSPRCRDVCISLLGGTIVGWLPGMTSGSAVTMCAPSVQEVQSSNDIDDSLRFIWLYSSISACGAVMSVGALFMIMRARSGSMDAIALFMGERIEEGSLLTDMAAISSILLSMLLAAAVSRWFLSVSSSWLGRGRKLLCSRGLAVVSLVFVMALSLALTGSRGALLMGAATSLGLIVPLAGVRRIQLMGCLLVPITVLLAGLR